MVGSASRRGSEYFGLRIVRARYCCSTSFICRLAVRGPAPRRGVQKLNTFGFELENGDFGAVAAALGISAPAADACVPCMRAKHLPLLPFRSGLPPQKAHFRAPKSTGFVALIEKCSWWEKYLDSKGACRQTALHAVGNGPTSMLFITSQVA